MQNKNRCIFPSFNIEVRLCSPLKPLKNYCHIGSRLCNVSAENQNPVNYINTPVSGIIKNNKHLNPTHLEIHTDLVLVLQQALLEKSVS